MNDYVGAFSDKMDGVSAFNSGMRSGLESYFPQKFDPQMNQNWIMYTQGSFGTLQHDQQMEMGYTPTTRQERELMNVSPKISLLIDLTVRSIQPS